MTVDTATDTVDFADSVTSLREAIFATNLVPGADEIQFDFGYDGPETITLTQGELAITDDLTITGPGAELLTIDAGGNDPTPDENNGDGSRVLNVDNGELDTLIDVMISGLTPPASQADGDATGNGLVDSNDLAVWEATFGRTDLVVQSTASSQPLTLTAKRAEPTDSADVERADQSWLADELLEQIF